MVRHDDTNGSTGTGMWSLLPLPLLLPPLPSLLSVLLLSRPIPPLQVLLLLLSLLWLPLSVLLPLLLPI